jgi:hypothetical protein
LRVQSDLGDAPDVWTRRCRRAGIEQMLAVEHDGEALRERHRVVDDQLRRVDG